MRRVISAETISEAAASGARSVAAARGRAVVTPAAWSKAQELGVTIDLAPDAVSEQPGAERTVDAGGAVLVRGASVELGDFAGAPGVGLTDVITAKDRSPMTAGFMAWRRDESFSWSLDYDEIDYVVEGVLHLGIGGRTLEGRPGDALYLPKGSRVLFGTPNRVRLFYVTYPANWAGQAPVKR